MLIKLSKQLLQNYMKDSASPFYLVLQIVLLDAFKLSVPQMKGVRHTYLGKMSSTMGPKFQVGSVYVNLNIR